MDSSAPVATVEESQPRRLIWWAGDRAGPLLAALDPGVVSTVAMSHAQIARNPTFVDEARRRRGLGLLAEGDAWRAQLHPEHPYRNPTFDALDWVDATGPHEPARWSAGFLDDFAEAYIDEQASLATILTTPGHYSPEPVGKVRRVDVTLAGMCADVVRAGALREPAPDDPHRRRRRLYATIVVRAGTLDRAAINWLVAAYRELSVDGYVLWAASFTGSLRQMGAACDLADELREATGRPVLMAGLGHLWQAALAHGGSGAVFGQRSKLVWPDESLRRDPAPADDEDEDRGFAVAAYHGAILGCTAIGSEHEPTRRRLHIRYPCPCGYHARGTPPVGKAEVLAHNLWWAQREARVAGAGQADRAALALALRAAAAMERRRKLGIGPLTSGWRVLADRLDAGTADAADLDV